MATNEITKPTLNRWKSDCTEHSDCSSGSAEIEVSLVHDDGANNFVVDIEDGTKTNANKDGALGQACCGKRLSQRKLSWGVAVLFSVVFIIVILSVTLRNEDTRSTTSAVSSAIAANDPQVTVVSEDEQDVATVVPEDEQDVAEEGQLNTSQSTSTSSSANPQRPQTQTTPTSPQASYNPGNSIENDNTVVVSQLDNGNSAVFQSSAAGGNQGDDGTNLGMSAISDSLDLSYDDWKMLMIQAHNNRRQVFFETNGVSHVPLKWSEGIAMRAQIYAEKLIRLDGCTILHGVDDDVYGGENIGYTVDYSQNPSAAAPDSLLTQWFDNEVYKDNLFDKLHFSQIGWRSTEYFGCGGAEKSLPQIGTCFIQVCRYIRPGNCNVDWTVSENDSLIPKMLERGSLCGDVCPPEGCY